MQGYLREDISAKTCELWIFLFRRLLAACGYFFFHLPTLDHRRVRFSRFFFSARVLASRSEENFRINFSYLFFISFAREVEKFQQKKKNLNDEDLRACGKLLNKIEGKQKENILCRKYLKWASWEEIKEQKWAR